VVSTLVQLVGVLLLVAAGVVLWSSWSLVIGGVLLLVVPEIGAARRRRP
jgi:hypothetical protein